MWAYGRADPKPSLSLCLQERADGLGWMKREPNLEDARVRGRSHITKQQKIEGVDGLAV